jgi:hypothetical protein
MSQFSKICILHYQGGTPDPESYLWVLDPRIRTHQLLGYRYMIPAPWNTVRYTVKLKVEEKYVGAGGGEVPATCHKSSISDPYSLSPDQEFLA